MEIAAHAPGLGPGVAALLADDRYHVANTNGELAKRLEVQGWKETEASITNKLAHATVPATFLLATMSAVKIEEIRLDDLWLPVVRARRFTTVLDRHSARVIQQADPNQSGRNCK